MNSHLEKISSPTLLQVLIPFGIILWLYWIWSRRAFYKFCVIYPTIWGIPILGVLPNMKRINNLFPAIIEIFEKKKKNSVCIWAGLYPVIITKDIEFIDFVLNDREFLDKADILYRPIDKAFRGGLISSTGKRWQTVKPLLDPCFHRPVLLSLFPFFNKFKTALVCKIDEMTDGRKCDLEPIVRAYMSALTTKTTMGNRIDDDKIATSTYLRNFEETANAAILKVFAGFLKLDRLIFFHGYRAANAAAQFVHELITHYINENRNDYKTEEPTSNIFIKHAIKLYQNRQFTWKDIIAESNTMVAASFETTASTVFSLLVMMAMFPDIQEKVYQELKSVFPDRNCDINYEDIGKLPFLEIVLKEVLRLVPPIPLMGRHLRKDKNLKDSSIVIPADMQIIICIFHLHRRTDIWGPDAAEFRPSRFLEENFTTEQRKAYMPFSKGPRNCIGFRYAQLALKVFAAGLLLNFEFGTDFKYKDLQFFDNMSIKYVTRPLLTVKKR